MQWVVALVCIVALMNGASGSLESVSAPFLNILLVVVGSFLVPTLTAWQTAGVLKRYKNRNIDTEGLHKSLPFYHFMHIGIWVAFCLFISIVLQWGLVVRTQLNAIPIPLFDELLILVPVLFPLLAGWAVLYEIERLATESGSSINTQAIQQTRWDYVAIRARWYLVMSVLPILVMWLARDIAVIPQPFMEQSTWTVLICLTFLVGKIAAFPFLMALVWDTRTIKDTHFGRRLFDISKQSKVNIWDVRLWRTNGQVLNAVVAGMLPRCRIIMLTDRLIDELDQNQIEGVFRHELTHARRWHLPIRIAAVLLPLICYFVVNHFNPSSVQNALGLFEPMGISTAWCHAVLLPTMYVVYLVAILGWISRTMEHDADIGACLRDDGHGVEELNDDAIGSFSNALLKISSVQNTSVTKKSWMHPSILERFEFLRAIRKDKTLINRFRQRFSLQMKILFGVTILIAAVFLVS